MRFVESGATGAVELVEVWELPAKPAAAATPVFDPELELQVPPKGDATDEEDAAEKDDQIIYQVRRQHV